MTTTPPSADAVAVFGLLSIIADPEAAKARMVELEKIRSSAEEAQEKHRVTLNELRQTAEVNANAIANNDRLLAERKAEIDNKFAAVNTAAAEQGAKERELQQRRADFAKAQVETNARLEQLSTELARREAELNTHEGDLKAREENLKDRGAKVAAVLDEAHAIKADYERKSAALQKALK